MKQTEYLKLNKPEATDFYNINDFNQNADKLDAAAKNCDDRLSFLETRLRDIRASVDIHAFADMKPVLGAERDVWNNASVQYSPIGGSWVFSCENISILAEYNTGDVIGVIREPYRPAEEISGTAVLSVSGNANLSCTVKALPNGQIVLAPEILHLAYKAGGSGG